MSDVRIELGHPIAFLLARLLAEELHGTLISLHLRALARHDGLPEPVSWDLFGENRRALRAALASIKDRQQRRSFIGSVRYCFHKMRDEIGTEPTSRAYVAKVRAFRERMGL